MTTKQKNLWINENYDRINLLVPRGMKAKLQSYAKEKHQSMIQVINRAIEREMNQ